MRSPSTEREARGGEDVVPGGSSAFSSSAGCSPGPSRRPFGCPAGAPTSSSTSATSAAATSKRRTSPSPARGARATTRSCSSWRSGSRLAHPPPVRDPVPPPYDEAGEDGVCPCLCERPSPGPGVGPESRESAAGPCPGRHDPGLGLRPVLRRAGRPCPVVSGFHGV